MPRSIPLLTGLVPVALTLLGCVRGDSGEEIGAGSAVRRPNILVYLVDTLRPDRLGCYGYERPTSPNVDAFAEEATLFENAIGQSSWTRASMASIFTGVWPPTHGTTGWKHELPEVFETLTEKLDADGTQTYQLYNWVEDAGETRDLAAEQADRTAALVGALEAKLAARVRGRNGRGNIADRRAPGRARGLGIPAIG